MPRSEGITTWLKDRWKYRAQYPRKCPDQRGLRLDDLICAFSGGLLSEEMPRSEGITTIQLLRQSIRPAVNPRKCPDQRGLRPFLPLNQRLENSYPRKCPDQRGLRRRSKPKVSQMRMDPRKCPDQRGLRRARHTLPLADISIRGNAPIRGDYDGYPPGHA